MTTPLAKPVRRRSTGYGVNRRPFVVTLEPPDLIGFRDAKTRRTFYTTLAACYALAVRQEVEARRREKAKKREAKRRADGR